MSAIIVGSTVVGAVAGGYNAYENAKAQNEAIKTQVKTAERRYRQQKDLTELREIQQQQLAVVAGTKVQRDFMLANGNFIASVAETETSGNSVERIKADLRTKRDEAQGRVIENAQTNILNLANSLSAQREDQMIIAQNAIAKMKDPFTEALDGAISGAMQGLNFGAGLSGVMSSGSSATSTVADNASATSTASGVKNFNLGEDNMLLDMNNNSLSGYLGTPKTNILEKYSLQRQNNNSFVFNR